MSFDVFDRRDLSPTLNVTSGSLERSDCAPSPAPATHQDIFGEPLFAHALDKLIHFFESLLRVSFKSDFGVCFKIGAM